jgi:hypothetical protein
LILRISRQFKAELDCGCVMTFHGGKIRYRLLPPSSGFRSQVSSLSPQVSLLRFQVSGFKSQASALQRLRL